MVKDLSVDIETVDGGHVKFMPSSHKPGMIAVANLTEEGFYRQSAGYITVGSARRAAGQLLDLTNSLPRYEDAVCKLDTGDLAKLSVAIGVAGQSDMITEFIAGFAHASSLGLGFEEMLAETLGRLGLKAHFNEMWQCSRGVENDQGST